ncbi:proteinase [Longispora fulva]|uniref:Pimeloyl-ACP methyl ester carboxylesterase n=1 Tax=Longispora fulva TaxID=619741 RepID=A0A8J7GCD5_9ACTN|nr:alpha/beta hydrolase [Longispora fulva]MBG6137958.1 pimeloyl-ACP methyl ester carboxylesterase [Longispora fulva]GIG60211.1 proteinase [Longispora fulva]
MSTGKRSIAVLLVLTAALAGCTGPKSRWTQPAPAGTTAARGLAWSPCRGLRVSANTVLDCATLAVPQDWARPAGATLDLALVRARRTGQENRIGSLVLNPGGPGSSGIDYATYFAGAVPVELLKRFDVVGFDPRGVGRSTPVECIPDAEKDAAIGADPDPVTDAQFAEVAGQFRRIGEVCGAKYGATLRAFSTQQTAQDIEAIRLAVGDPKLTYLGYSYGTLLGAVYAHRYPTTIRAAVLDGAVDPGKDPVASAEGQAAGFELAFTNFAAWCATAGASTCPVGPDARATADRILAAARARPATSGTRQATSGWIFLAIVGSLYQRDEWPQLAAALADVRDGDPARVFRIADGYYGRDAQGHYSNLLDANTAVNCADSAKDPTAEQVRVLQGQWRAKYPLFGANLALGLLTCTYWPGGRDPFSAGPATGAPPLLVVGTRGDPATPYEQTAALATLLGTGRVLTWDGDGHTAYPNTRCVVEAVDRYLIDLVVPPAGTVCPAT